MASVRSQILNAVEIKLEEVRAALAWTSLVVNPRVEVGEDQWNALVLFHGGDREPASLTGHRELRWLEFSVAWIVRESASATAEELLDAGLVAVSDALLDPADIQLSGLAVAIEQGAISEPVIGPASRNGARILGGQAMDFAVQYMAVEGDASTAGP